LADTALILDRARRFLAERPTATEAEVGQRARDLFLADEAKFQMGADDFALLLFPVILWRRWTFGRRLAKFEKALDEALVQPG
jgi:hypothetical protein